MHYKFPHIDHLDQVLEAIDGVDGFIVAQRDWGTVVNYVQMGPDMFPEVHTAGGSARMREHQTRLKAIRRECRGIAFSPDGKLISRPLHKFWNAGEKRETLLENIDLSKPHVIMTKMDGSMIRPIPVADGYRLGTKMGVTDVALQAENFLRGAPNIDRFIRDSLEQGYTAIFEWCSRQQKIVIDYPRDRLVLIAVRHIHSGEYMTYHQMQELAAEYQLDLVQVYAGTVENMQHLVEYTRGLEDQEGWVIRWNDGHMCKLKADAYVRIHRAKDALMQEKNLIELMLTEKLDDVKGFLPHEDLARIEVYEREFWQGVQDTAAGWNLNYQTVRKRFGTDRKTFALEWANGFDAHLRSLIFRAWDNPDFDWRLGVLGVIGKNLSSQTRVDEARYLHGAGPWRMQNPGDE